jgi:thiamine biosynthesis lipoprotein
MSTVMFAVLLLVPSTGEVAVKRSWPVMGTFAEVTLDRSASARTEEAVEAVRKVFDRVNRTMSVYKPTSDITRVNRWAGFRSIGVDPWVAELVARGKRAQWVSGGAFRLDTLGDGVERGLKPDLVNVVPGEYGITALHVEKNPSRIRLARPGMGLDLGGIAKGYALDRAGEALRDRGFDRFLINLGRSLKVGDPPRGRDGWPVKISGESELRRLRNTVLSTSQQGLRSDTNHIVTGGTDRSGGTSVRSVTVSSPRGWVSDFASTALLVNPKRENRIRSVYDLDRVWFQPKTSDPAES